MWVIPSPIRVPVTLKKDFILNLNHYRNAHQFTLHKAKVTYEEMVTPLVVHLPKLDKVRMSYLLFPKSRQLCDVSNFCSIVDKFFSDTLVSAGILPDDNYEHVIMVAYGFGGIDRDNPRVDVVIEPL